MWTWQYVEFGGYDAMYDSVNITNDQDETVVRIDLRYLGQDNCGEPLPGAKEKAVALAEKIVAALNA